MIRVDVFVNCLDDSGVTFFAGVSTMGSDPIVR